MLFFRRFIAVVPSHLYVGMVGSIQKSITVPRKKHTFEVPNGESEKWTSWKASIKRRDEQSAGGVEFVPFSIEAGGVWGPAARKFFRECVALADDDRDVDLYHWSSTRFSRAWFDSLSVLVARGRAKVSAAAAASDWPKRIRDMQHIDVEDLD